MGLALGARLQIIVHVAPQSFDVSLGIVLKLIELTCIHLAGQLRFAAAVGALKKRIVEILHRQKSGVRYGVD